MGVFIMLFVITIILAICGIAAVCVNCMKAKTKVIGISIVVAVMFAIVGSELWYLFNTESGKRMYKTFNSNVNGGIERTITIYDINGNVITEYSGKFDVDYDSDRIVFDDENGKRHTIYYTTGTVVIDEK